MCAGPPATLDCKKRLNNRLAESRRRVDGFPATAFVNWTNCCSMADSSIHSRAVPLSLEPYVLGAVHHWQKWNASLFSPWHFEHRALPWVSDTRISVLGRVLVTGIPQTRRDSTAPRIGRMERISRSRFCRACRMLYVCGGGAWREIGAVPPDGCKRCYRALIGRCDRSQCAPRVLIRRWLVVMCVCAFVYQCVGVVYPCGVRGCPCINDMCTLKSTSTARMPPRLNVYGSAPRWWCTLKNWLSSPWDAICTERTPAPSTIGNHDARVLVTALAAHLLMCANITPTKNGCGKQ